jgi:hypothetical protein
VALLLVLTAVAIGAGAGLIHLPSQPLPAPTPVPSDTRLRPIHIDDWAVRVSIPSTWTEIDPTCCDYRHFGGTSPEGHISIGHESPYTTAVCSPMCQDIDLHMTSIPYSASAQLDALKFLVGGTAGSQAWSDLPPDVLPQIEGGARLETTATDDAGREWRRVHIVGLRKRNVVAIAWSQPADRFDPALLDAVLATVELTPAPVYSDGDLIDDVIDPFLGESDFRMPIPGFWTDADQPFLDGTPMTGVHRFNGGRVVVSLGDAIGRVGLCDPGCRELIGQTSLDALERSIREGGRAFGAAVSTTLGGEPAVSIETEERVVRRYVMAIHDQRPVVLMLHAGDWQVGPGIFDAMVEGFEFVDHEPAPAAQAFLALGGRVQLGLSAGWERLAGTEDRFRRGPQRLTVRVGGSDGSIVTCDKPAGPWELCRTIQATNLEDLAAAVQPAAIPDHGIGPPVGRQETGTLDGEASVVTRIPAYEYPARSGQEVAYIVAMHDGRPYILRIWTRADRIVDLRSVIAGFRFLD